MAGFWRKCRIVWRALRFALWTLLVAGLLVFAWFNLVGLPNFLKTRLVTTLREHNLQLEFTRLRLRFIHGVVAENVRLGLLTGTTDATRQPPVLAVKEVQLHLNFPALLHARFELDGLVLRDGRLTVPVSPTNGLEVLNLQTDLRFKPQDTWALDNFHADFAGIKISLAGEIVHAPEMGNWPMFAAGQPGTTTTTHAAGQPLLQQISDTLAKIQFAQPPQVSLNVNGDARNLHTFTVHLNTTVPEVTTPWCRAEKVQFSAGLTAPVAVPTNAAPALAWWTNLQPFRVTWNVRTAAVHTEKLNADAVETTGQWLAPRLSVAKFFVQLGGGTLNLGATLDVATRELVFTNDASFDLHLLASLLPDAPRGALAAISWSQPPVISVNGSLTVPAWTNRAPDWTEALTNSANVRGELACTNTTALGVMLNYFGSRFAYASHRVNLTNTTLIQERTRLTLAGEHDLVSRDFSFGVRGAFALQSLTPFMPHPDSPRGFGLLHFTEPLALDVSGRGNAKDFSRFTAAGRLALTNFAVRSETIDSVVTDVAYTNQWVNFLRPQIARAGGQQTMTADNVALDLTGLHLYVTNGFSTMDPLVVGRAIGPKTALAMSPYQFLAIPTTHVNGCIPLRNDAHDDLILTDANLRVDIIEGVRFRWRRFETPNITGTVHWLANYLIVTNAEALAYGGPAHGWGAFNLTTPGAGTDFKFFMAGTNVNFHAMATALWAPTNNLEGALSGWVEVTRANSDDWRTWNGLGAAQLRDGLIWDTPMIKVLSPVLNAVIPGMGNSRATQATGTFTMTNGVVFSDTAEIRSLMMRMQYNGTVDLEQNVNAKVTAQLLRNTLGVGAVMSAALWPLSKIFECQVTGTLSDPKAKPVLLIPRLLLVPLHPIRSLEDMFAVPATNAPAAK